MLSQEKLEEELRKLQAKSYAVAHVLSCLIVSHPEKDDLRRALTYALRETEKSCDRHFLMQDMVSKEAVEVSQLLQAELKRYIRSAGGPIEE